MRRTLILPLASALTLLSCIHFSSGSEEVAVPKAEGEIRVMVIDTGIAELPETKPFLSSINSKNDLEDKHGHGTHIAGIILYGRHGDDKVCEQVKLLSCKFYGPEGEKLHTTANCFRAAKNMQVDFVNFSGGGRERDEAEERAVKAYPGKIVVAAGNEETDKTGKVTKPAWDISKEAYYPASLNLPNMVVVGNGTRQELRSDSSNYGLPGMVWRDGSAISSLDPKGGKRVMSGTSQATAIYTHELLKKECQRRRSVK